MATSSISITTSRAATVFDAYNALRQLQSIKTKYTAVVTALGLIGVTVVVTSVNTPTVYAFSYLGVQRNWTDLNQLWTVGSPDSVKLAALKAQLLDQQAGDAFLGMARYMQ